MRVLWVVSACVVPMMAYEGYKPGMSLIDKIPTEDDATYVLEPILQASGNLRHVPPSDFKLMVSRQWLNLADTVLEKGKEEGIDFCSTVPKACEDLKKKKIKAARKKVEELTKGSASKNIEDEVEVSDGPSEVKPSKSKSSLKTKKAESLDDWIASEDPEEEEKPAKSGKKAEEKSRTPPAPAKKKGLYMLEYDGYEYRTLEESIKVEKKLWQQSDATCCRDWRAMPEGYEIAPDTPELRKVLTQYTWSTHVVILDSLKGYATFQGNGFTLGQHFGDHQDKAKRTVKRGQVGYSCPWECYHVIIRRPSPKRGEL